MYKYLLLASVLLTGCSKPKYYVFKTVKHVPKSERVATAEANQPSSDSEALPPVSAITPPDMQASSLPTMPQMTLPVLASVPTLASPPTPPVLTARQKRIKKRLERRYHQNKKYLQEAPSADGPATSSLVLGILSVALGIVGAILGPIAIANGSRALRIIRENPGEEDNKGMAKAGKILGIIGTVLGGITLLVLIGALLGG